MTIKEREAFHNLIRGYREKTKHDSLSHFLSQLIYVTRDHNERDMRVALCGLKNVIDTCLAIERFNEVKNDRD